ncbi:BQ5605_C015g07870 [Microbotryum silenes-dioicae]|uniref:RING-type E3 ubiquitin transferase n=1 Tax=Microbotryum silenes-dioicae TaxID=796604 RepID=A0A2X0LT21_9BASI|nr:BQ5605_C015g07870 [Microbotryum silenes-dioicae]
MKRLAKLQQSQPAQSSSSSEASTSTTSTSRASATVPAPAPARAPSQSPSQSRGSIVLPAAPVQASLSNKSTPIPTPTPTPSTSKAVGASTPQATLPRSTSIESFEDWQHTILQTVLRVTLDREQAEAFNWSITYLKDVAEEIAAETAPDRATPLKLDAESIDRLLLARLSLSPSVMTDDPEIITVVAALPENQTSFGYLGGCWKRERAERQKLLSRKNLSAADLSARVEVLNKAKALIVSYTGLVLIDPSMFPQEHTTPTSPGPLELAGLLLPMSNTGPKTSTLQSTDLPALLQDLAGRFTPSPANDEEGGLEEVIGPLISYLGTQLIAHKVDIGGSTSANGASWRDVLGAVQTLSEIKGVASTLPQCHNWVVTGTPQAQAPLIEMLSLLGPFLRLSAFPDSFPAIAKVYFPEPSTQGRGNLDSAAQSLRGTLSGVQHILFQILNNVVRSGPVAREAVLSYFGNVARANVKRSAMRVDARTVSSHGFIINLHTALLAFAQPFTDAQFSKIDKIDSLYYRKSRRIDIADETKMSATQSESEEYYLQAADEAQLEPVNFISEVFFLCCTYFRLGIMHAIKEHKGFSQQIRHMTRELADMETDQTYRGTPGEARALAEIERYKKRAEMFKSHLEAYQVQLFDTTYLSNCLGFANLVIAWLVRQVDPKKQHPQVRVQLPMPDETPLGFRMLPEFLIEDITEFLSFASKAAPLVLAEQSQDELVTFMLVFLSTPYMKNPYLKGQFVEIMYYLTRPMPRYPTGCLGDVLNFNPLALKHLMPCLIHAYIEIEITGSHTQFYDKFNTRYYITQLFKLVWSNQSHREALKLESQLIQLPCRNLDRYVRFANLLMNDTTYLLDDALSHLAKIADIQKQMDDRAAWDARPVAERQEQEKLLRQYEGQVRGDLDLGTESLRLLKLFAGEAQEPFLTPEIVDRLAAMLDMNLSMLAGPRCQELKVREPEKLNFRPKELLSDVLAIFLELGPRSEFQYAVAKDGRSYSKDLFDRATRIARKTAIKTDVELREIVQLVEKVEVIKAAEEEDDAMGEIPDDFLDPLTYEIMRDPVRLPSSKTVVDRSTIKQHYLSDATDPFNRVPLKWENIVDAADVKEQIEAFLAERKAKRLAAKGAGE